ncbi:MAG: HEPN domain-containing protein [Magnetococcales bacterium]|nr:HEPN domain-containing protein [Magnetococcales bacterium]
MNIAKHIDYWRTGSNEDWEMAEIALEKGKIRHGLFFLHLAMEKLVKAHVTKKTEKTPMKIHNLLFLAQQTDLSINHEMGKSLTVLNSYCLEGRYADETGPPPSLQEAKIIFQQVQEIRTWMLNQL